MSLENRPGIQEPSQDVLREIVNASPLLLKDIKKKNQQRLWDPFKKGDPRFTTYWLVYPDGRKLGLKHFIEGKSSKSVAFIVGKSNSGDDSYSLGVFDETASGPRDVIAIRVMRQDHCYQTVADLFQRVEQERDERGKATTNLLRTLKNIK